MPKKQSAEGVALSIPKTKDRHEAGVRPAVPLSVSVTESKSGQKATPNKEKS